MRNSIHFLCMAVFFVLLQTAATHAQRATLPINPDNEKIRFQEVVHVEGSPKELFNRCVNWLNNYYKNPVRITHVRDQGAGLIAGRHSIRLHYTDDDGNKRDAASVFYEFTIELREDRFRYTFSDLVLRTASRFEIERWLDKDDPAYDPRWDDYLDQIAAYVDQWSRNLIEMMQPEPEVIEDDW